MSQMNDSFKSLGFTNWCIRNRTAIYVFTVILSIAGIVSFMRIPKEQFPDIVIPTISVSTIYPGATPVDVENLITKPIERQLKSINGVRKISSKSISDFSSIVVEFNTNVEVAVAKQKVSDAVDKASKDLPTDMDEDPRVDELDFSEFPIMNINLAGELPLDKLKSYGEYLEERIETLPQITRVDIVGGLNREIQIYVDLYKMQAAGISFNDIEMAVGADNVNISGGEIRIDRLRRNVRVTGQFKDAEQIKNIVVRSSRGNTVFLRDFASIVDGYAEKQDFARLDGKPVVTLNIIKRSGENLLEASEGIQRIIEEAKAAKFPEGLNVIITGDQSESTKNDLNELLNTVIIGFILVLVGLMFFMGLKSAFFVALAGPLSTLVAFLIMPGLDYTLNVIVLFSFLLALGIIVDDAIVVIENTHRLLHKHREINIIKAAQAGAGEVFVPVLAGTLTTLGPFFPLLFWPGIVGNFMQYLPVTLIITLGASLLVAFVMNPVFAVDFMVRDEHLQVPKRSSFVKWAIAYVVIALLSYLGGFTALGSFALIMLLSHAAYQFFLYKTIRNFQESYWPVVVRAYERMLTKLTAGRAPYAVVGVAVVALILSTIGFGLSNPKVSFFPDPEPNFAYVYCELPIGTDANVTDSITQILEKRVFALIGPNNPAVESVIANVGLNAGDPQNPDRVATPNKSKVTVAFVKYSERNGFETRKMLDEIRKDFEKNPIPGATLTVEKERAGPPTGKPVNIEISGEDFTALQDLEQRVRQDIAAAGITGIEELKSDLKLNKPEIILEIDQEKAQREGISLASIGMSLRTALYGKEISKLRDADDDHPIQLRLKESFRSSPEQLLALNIAFMDMATGRFRQVPLAALASISYKPAYSGINRKNQKRVVTLSSNVVEGGNANQINQELQAKVLNALTLPEGYEVRLTGEQEDQKETSDFLGVAFLGALALMFAVMVTQFNSVVKPLLIFSTVLFSLIGIFIGFGLSGMTMSVVMTGVGMFALAGIVIRNGILLIEFIDEQRAAGVDPVTASIQAGATRITPVILTAVSTISGLIPLAIGFNINFGTLLSDFKPNIHLGGDNVAFWGPLAWTIIFGLTIATFLTLIVIPSMYVAAWKTKHKIKGLFSKV